MWIRDREPDFGFGKAVKNELAQADIRFLDNPDVGGFPYGKGADDRKNFDAEIFCQTCRKQPDRNKADTDDDAFTYNVIVIARQFDAGSNNS